MDRDKYAVSQNQLVNRIRDVVKTTESIFDKIAELFPTLYKELEKSRDEFNQEIHALEISTDAIQREGSSSSLLAQTKSIINEASDTFHTLHDQDDQLLDTLKHDIEEIKNLDKGIHAIRESSESMELISLNAMTVAIKAGKAGGAFSFITEELKRISARSIIYTEELTREGKEIDKAFQAFLESMEKIETIQTDLFSNFGSFVNKGFSEAGQASAKAIAFLKDVHQESGKVKDPLINIMQQVQHQDIIRQSLDHVVLAIGELKEIEQEWQDLPLEEQLDELSFLKSIPRLCSDLIGDVLRQIRKSHELFRSNIQQIRSFMKHIEEKAAEYKKKDEVGEFFHKTEASINQVQEDVRASLEMKSQIIAESSNLMLNVRELQESFVDFSELVGQFQNVNVASKIEIAKQEALTSMNATVGEMSELTVFIDETVENALKSIKRFFKQTDDSILFYRDVYKREEEFSKSFQLNMSTISQRVKETLGKIEHVIDNFSVFREGFYQSYRQAEQLLEDLYSCGEQLEEAIQDLIGIESDYNSAFNKVLEKSSYSSWEIHDERLQKIIERFTILEHKQAAGKIGGFEVEDGTDSGDVTFF